MLVVVCAIKSTAPAKCVYISFTTAANRMPSWHRITRPMANDWVSSHANIYVLHAVPVVSVDVMVMKRARLLQASLVT
jgi:hypothetical protein